MDIVNSTRIRTRKEWLEIQRRDEIRGYSEFIAQHKSVLICESIVGCNLRCAYCFRNRKEFKRPRRVIGDEEVIRNLLNHPFFIADRTPLAIHCNTTDPFLPQVKGSTFKMLEILDGMEFRNIVSLITKVPLSDEEIRYLGGFRNLDIEICVSYAEMPTKVEAIGNRKRIDFLKRLSSSTVKTILFYRPLIIGWNTSSRHIRKVLFVAKEAEVDVIMVGGVRLSDEERQLIREGGLGLPTYKTQDYKKYLPRDLKQILLRIYDELGLKIPMVRRTSCGRSVLRGIPDYNGHWVEPDRNCWPTCPLSQRKICANKRLPSLEKVRALLKRIDRDSVDFCIDKEKRTLILLGDISVFEINFLRNSLGIPVERTDRFPRLSSKQANQSRNCSNR